MHGRVDFDFSRAKSILHVRFVENPTGRRFDLAIAKVGGEHHRRPTSSPHPDLELWKDSFGVYIAHCSVHRRYRFPSMVFDHDPPPWGWTCFRFLWFPGIEAIGHLYLANFRLYV